MQQRVTERAPRSQPSTGPSSPWHDDSRCGITRRDAGDLVHEAVIAMTCGATYTQLASAIHIRPALAEGVNSAAGGIHREIGA
jgi:hypothetical protein